MVDVSMGCSGTVALFSASPYHRHAHMCARQLSSSRDITRRRPGRAGPTRIACLATLQTSVVPARLTGHALEAVATCYILKKHFSRLSGAPRRLVAIQFGPCVCSRVASQLLVAARDANTRAPQLSASCGVAPRTLGRIASLVSYALRHCNLHSGGTTDRGCARCRRHILYS